MFGDVFRGRTVWLSGHTGFKGAWLSLWLTRLGARVTGLDFADPRQPLPAGVADMDDVERAVPARPADGPPQRRGAGDARRGVPRFDALSACATQDSALRRLPRDLQYAWRREGHAAGRMPQLSSRILPEGLVCQLPPTRAECGAHGRREDDRHGAEDSAGGTSAHLRACTPRGTRLYAVPR